MIIPWRRTIIETKSALYILVSPSIVALDRLFYLNHLLSGSSVAGSVTSNGPNTNYTATRNGGGVVVPAQSLAHKKVKQTLIRLRMFGGGTTIDYLPLSA